MYIESFPSKLKQARKEIGYTQEETASIININRSALAKYETGTLEPCIETLGKLADLYCVSTDWLIGTKGGKA